MFVSGLLGVGLATVEQLLQLAHSVGVLAILQNLEMSAPESIREVPGSCTLHLFQQLCILHGQVGNPLRQEGLCSRSDICEILD